MFPSLKSLTKQLLPPAVLAGVQHLRQPSDTGFWGNYSSFEAAQSASEGYDTQRILDKALAATLSVVQGNARAERDTVLFDTPLYVYPAFAIILKIAAQLNRPMVVCDFGGALGSTYFQFRDFMAPIMPCLEWHIVEQPHFIACGRQHFQNETLKFTESLENVPPPDVVLLSSVLQYLPTPYQWLQTFLDLQPSAIIVDRTPFFLGQKDRITIQKVPAHIYKASYPCWLLNYNQIKAMLNQSYECIYEADALEGMVITKANRCLFKDMIYWRQASALSQ